MVLCQCWMFYLGCVIWIQLLWKNQDPALSEMCKHCICWMLLFHSCFDSGVFWPELSAAHTLCISQIFILFRNTWLYWDGNGVRWFNGHTRRPFWVPKVCSFGGLLSEIRQPKGHLGDHEMPWFKTHWGDMKVCRRWRGLDGNYWSSRQISKGD